jgi:hypothetical protein
MYGYMMGRFTKFCELKGYMLLDQWGPIDVREFRASWQVATNTARKNMTILKSFFEFAVSNEWIVRNPARLVKELRNRSENRSKEPHHKETGHRQNRQPPENNPDRHKTLLAKANQTTRLDWHNVSSNDCLSVQPNTQP